MNSRQKVFQEDYNTGILVSGLEPRECSIYGSDPENNPDIRVQRECLKYHIIVYTLKYE